MMYSRQVIDLFVDPENEGRIQDADGEGDAFQKETADFFKIFIKVNEKKIIEDIKFEVFGCCEAVSAGSMVTILAKGKPVDEAKKLTGEDVLLALGGLPKSKIYCCVLAVTALNQALSNYSEQETAKDIK